MKASETIALIKALDIAEFFLVYVVRDLDSVEIDLRQIKELGYAAFLRNTAFGSEIVITDKINDGPA